MVDPAQWARLVPDDGVFGTPEWSGVYDRDPSGHCEYLVARSGPGRPVCGILPVHKLRHLAGPYQPAALLDDPAAAGYLLLGARSGFHNVVVAGGTSTQDRSATVRALLAAATRHAREVGADGLVWPYLAGPSAADLAEVLGPGTAQLVPGPDVAVFDVAASWDEHVAALPSRRRRRFRRENQEFDDTGLQIVLRDRIDPGWLARLVCALDRKYGLRTTPAGVADLIDRIQSSGLEIVCFVCVDGAGSPIAASLAVVRGERMWPRLIGIDRDRTGTAPVYFQLAFYAPIRELPPAAAAGSTSAPTPRKPRCCVAPDSCRRSIWPSPCPRLGRLSADHPRLTTGWGRRRWRMSRTDHNPATAPAPRCGGHPAAPTDAPGSRSSMSRCSRA